MVCVSVCFRQNELVIKDRDLKSLELDKLSVCSDIEASTGKDWKRSKRSKCDTRVQRYF